MRPCFPPEGPLNAPGVMRSFYIALPEDAADRLRELARSERRSPRQQATVLVLAGLDRADRPSPRRKARARQRAETEAA